MDNLYHATDYIGMAACHIVVFMQVHRQVIKTWRSLYHYHLPVTHPDRYLVSLFKLPIKKVMRFLSLLPQ